MVSRRFAGVVLWKGDHIAIRSRSTAGLVIVGVIIVLLFGGALALSVFFFLEPLFLSLAKTADSLNIKKVQIIGKHIPNHFGVTFF